MQNILLEGFDKNIFGKVLHYKQLLAYTNFDANRPGMFTTQLQTMHWLADNSSSI